MDNTTTVALPSGISVAVFNGADMAGRRQLELYDDLQKNFYDLELNIAPNFALVKIQRISFRHFIKTWTAVGADGAELPTPTVENDTINAISQKDINALWKVVNEEMSWQNPSYERKDTEDDGGPKSGSPEAPSSPDDGSTGTKTDTTTEATVTPAAS